jgi:hypothetical protein
MSTLNVIMTMPSSAAPGKKSEVSHASPSTATRAVRLARWRDAFGQQAGPPEQRIDQCAFTRVEFTDHGQPKRIIEAFHGHQRIGRDRTESRGSLNRPLAVQVGVFVHLIADRSEKSLDLLLA